LRYRGNSHNQVKKQRNLYFVAVSVEQQLSKLLERTGIWAKIQQYKNTPNYSSSIRTLLMEQYTRGTKKVEDFSPKKTIELYFLIQMAYLYTNPQR